jgi:hypothetical protein
MAASKQQADKFLANVITPTLELIDLWSPAAEELLLGTAIMESHLTYRRQFGNGPARGLFQMEPATHDDIWNNFLKFKPTFAKAVSALLSKASANKLTELEINDRYACAMARMHYRRKSEPLPAAGDVQAMATYWKRHYNTVLGAGDPQDYVAKWNKTMCANKRAMDALPFINSTIDNARSSHGHRPR